MKVHPVTKLFPMMTPEQFKGLKLSIKEVGVKTPIWTYKGAIIDGRNRYKACKQLGIKCPTQEWDGQGSLTLFVTALNLERRHLAPKQCGLIAVRMIPMLEKEAAARKVAAGKEAGKKGGRGRSTKKGGGPQTPKPKRKEQTRATDQAAQAVGVSGSTVRRLQKIEKDAPDLVPFVEDDTLSIPEAGFIATIDDPQERARVVKETKKHGFDEAIEMHEERELGPARRAKQIGNALERCRKGASKLAQDMTHCLSLLKGAEESGNRVTVGGEAWSTFSAHVGLILSTAKQIREYTP